MRFLFVASILSITSAFGQDNTIPSATPTPRVLEVSMYDSPEIDHEVAMDHPYDIVFNVKKTSDGQHQLVTSMKLHGGSFYVSPHSTTDFKGKFKIELATNDDLSIGDKFVETPRSVEVVDPHQFVNGPVNWVQEDTKYVYPLRVNSKEDFTIGGKIIFVIEPKCTLEQVPIMFKYRSGVLTVEKWKC